MLRCKLNRVNQILMATSVTSTAVIVLLTMISGATHSPHSMDPGKSKNHIYKEIIFYFCQLIIVQRTLAVANNTKPELYTFVHCKIFTRRFLHWFHYFLTKKNCKSTF